MISTLSTTAARRLALGAGSLVLCLMGFVPDADADPEGDGVTLKAAIEQHYIAKVERLLAPSFTTKPAVSVDVELDLKRVQTTTTGGTGERTVETVIAAPGAIVRKSIAVALPMEELPAGMGLESFRQLIVAGCNVTKQDRLELLPLTARVATPAAAQPATPAVPVRSTWEEAAPLLGAGAHVLWAVVALVVAFLGWSVLRQIADRPPADPVLAAQLQTPPPAPAPPAPQPVVVNVPVPQAPAPAPVPERKAPERGPKGKADAASSKGKGRPQPARDPLQDVQKRIAADPVRAAEALAGWINA